MYLRTSLDKLFHHLLNFRIFKCFPDGCCGHLLAHNLILHVYLIPQSLAFMWNLTAIGQHSPICYSWEQVPPPHFSQVFTDLLFMSCSLFSQPYWLHFDSSFSKSGSTVFCTPPHVHILNKQTVFWIVYYPFHTKITWQAIVCHEWQSLSFHSVTTYAGFFHFSSKWCSALHCLLFNMAFST